MKVVFTDNNKNFKEYKIETQDLKQLFQIAENLSDFELEKIKQTIDQFSLNEKIQSGKEQVREY